MIATRRYLLTFLLISCTIASRGQGVSISDTVLVPDGYKPKMERVLKHEAIDKLQQSILASDGKADKFFSPSNNEEINFLLTKAIIKKTDNLQYLIETDAVFDHRLKVNYLYGLENVLKYFRQNWKLRTDKKVNPVNLGLIISAYEACMKLDRNGESIEGVIDMLPYDGGMTLVNAGIFDKNPGLKVSKDNLVRKYCALYPKKIFVTLKEFPDVPFADSLIRTVARKSPRELYDYAAANNKLAIVIRNIQDDIFISSISRMARSKSGQQYFPFLDNIVNGRMTIESIDSVKNDSILYYRLLVKTQIEYVERAMNKDTAYEFKALSARLEKKAQEDFVNKINGLHNESAEVRFKCIQPLTAEELYYLAVSSDGSIYTSSFVKGVYPLMMKKINNRGDSLLLRLNFDKYRRFIKMAAGYNTLSNFLSSFPPRKTEDDESEAEKLMKAFVGRLERGNGLEDGVDVADSYASIAETLKPIAKEMLNNIELNLKRNEEAGNQRGIAIYRILQKLFLSADSSNHIDLTKELGIPPVYEVPYSSMVNDSGRVIMQVFFYGDKDGQGIFRGFLGMFPSSHWKITSTDQWVCVNSTKGKPVSIYANKALPEEGGLDEKAQKALCAYLEKNNLNPTITIHRGHSYYAGSTISQMFPSSKIVFLGSCGGYHLIHDVLEKAPDAHIIASKQIGATGINKCFQKILNDKLIGGKNVNWISFWKEMEDCSYESEFEDYIPPYKNLGALFIKAYKIATEEKEEE